MPDYCFINGEVKPSQEASIGISDIGLLRGYAAFDFLRTYNGRPFRISDHLQRFRNSARDLHLPVKYSDEELIGIIEDLLKKSGVEEAGVRLVLTGGYATDSMSASEPNFIISIERLPQYPPGIYEKGVKLMLFEYQRDAPWSKTTEYVNAIRLEPEKQKRGVFDILYHSGDEVLELTRTNFFLFKNDTLVTPRQNVLKGITRKVALELAQGRFATEERKVLVDELKEAGEAFLCGTTRGIVPVVRIDDFPVGDGTVGKHTRKLMELFGDYTSKN